MYSLFFVHVSSLEKQICPFVGTPVRRKCCRYLRLMLAGSTISPFRNIDCPFCRFLFFCFLYQYIFLFLLQGAVYGILAAKLSGAPADNPYSWQAYATLLPWVSRPRSIREITRFRGPALQYILLIVRRHRTYGPRLMIDFF